MGDDGQVLAAPEPGPVVAGPDGTRIATWHLGGDGPPLLFTHGTGLTSAMWWGVTPHLAGHSCWAVDMRGHGASGPSPTRTYDDWHLAGGDLLAVVDALGIAGCIGVGHSFGAASLLLAELARPGTFAGLWCYEPIVVPADAVADGGPDTGLAEGARRRRNHFESVGDALGRFAGRPPFASWAPGLVEAYVATATRPEPGGTGIELVLPGPEEATCYEGAARHGAWGRLGEVGVPVVVAAGVPDEPGAAPVGPAAWATPITERLGKGRMRAFAGLTHFGPCEQPSRVALAIADDAAAITGGVTPPR